MGTSTQNVLRHRGVEFEFIVFFLLTRSICNRVRWVLELFCQFITLASGGTERSMKLVCCRSRTYLMQPLPPCMPNVRKWRGQGGCGPQVCHPSVGAAGNGQAKIPRIYWGGEGSSQGKYGYSIGCGDDLTRESLEGLTVDPVFDEDWFCNLNFRMPSGLKVFALQVRWTAVQSLKPKVEGRDCYRRVVLLPPCLILHHGACAH